MIPMGFAGAKTDRILGASRGVGFARMESKEICETIIEKLNGAVVEGKDGFGTRFLHLGFIT